MPARPYALVLGPDEAAREPHCRDLTRAGYQAIGFDACDEALVWLEEETPALAVILTVACERCAALLASLEDRRVEVVRFEPHVIDQTAPVI